MRYFIAVGCLLVVIASLSSAKRITRSLRSNVPTSDVQSPAARRTARGASPAHYSLDLAGLPQNQAVYPGATVTHVCLVDPAAANTPRIHWVEYAYSPGGMLISEGGIVLGHPQAARYAINTTMANQFDLIISNVVVADGGAYLCEDLNAPTVEQKKAVAQLIVIAGPQNCTTTVRPDGQVAEGTYYTNECTLDYKGDIIPNMEWSGPSPFSQGQTSTSSRVWSGMSFTADRTMGGNHYSSKANFTGYFLPPPIDSATNIPAFQDDEAMSRLSVNWSPRDMYADPVKPLNEYLVGDRLDCYADAFPTASYNWMNMRTFEEISNQGFTIPDYWQGFSQTMRCRASNSFMNANFTADLFITVNVPAPTTPPTTPTTPTTTTAPPVSDCLDFTGRWRSSKPHTLGDLCINKVNESNGVLSGGFRNGTDTFWLNFVGNTNVPRHQHVAFSIIWPENAAATSFVGECSRCYGMEVLLIGAITRSKGTVTCGVPGEISYSDEFTFLRDPATCPNFLPPS